MKASIVLTTFDDDLRLHHALCGWLRQTLVEELQVIVVDDGGSAMERTRDLVLSLEPRVAEVNYVYLRPSKRELGRQVFRLAAARNAGLRRVRTPLTIISDCDTIPRPDVAAFMLEHARDDRVVIGVRKRIHPTDFPKLRTFTTEELEGLAWCDDERLSGVLPPESRAMFLSLKDTAPEGSWGFCWGCLFAAPTKHLKALGGFDERFQSWGGEDSDMAERLVRGAGLKLYSLPEAVVYHLDHPPRCPEPYKADLHLAEIHRNWTAVRNGGPIA